MSHRTDFALTALTAHFQENFTVRGELGAAVSVWRGGEEVLSLAGGFSDREKSLPFTSSTPVLVWSATKGPASACLLHVLAAEGIPLDTPVAALWPEFAQHGKDHVTLAQVLSHQAGLPAIDGPSVSILDHSAVAERLASQPPLWPPGEGHGYHPRTFGFLLDEIVRRLRPGMTLGGYWRDTFAEPLGLDFWIGLPERFDARVSPVYAARNPLPTRGADETAFQEALSSPGSLTRKAFSTPAGLHAVREMNTLRARRAELPSLGGIGTARALAKFYAMLSNGGTLDGRNFFSEAQIPSMSKTLSSGPDRVLCMETAFSAGFMQDPVGPDGRKLRSLFGPSRQAFGQPGAGGSHAFADPENGIAFAYTMNQMEPGVLPNEKALGLVESLHA